MLFAHGLDNISENQYAELKEQLSATYNLSMAAVKESDTASDATRFAVKLQRFMHLMDTFKWDFSTAILDSNTSLAAIDLGSQQSLLEANAVESFFISKCGMPSTVAFDTSADTLPSPVIASPTATDPPTEGINQDSQSIATGNILAGIYGLTLTNSEALCLGNALDGVVDATSAAANADEYASQFNKAFALCGINTSTNSVGG